MIDTTQPWFEAEDEPCTGPVLERPDHEDDDDVPTDESVFCSFDDEGVA